MLAKLTLAVVQKRGHKRELNFQGRDGYDYNGIQWEINISVWGLSDAGGFFGFL